MGAGLFCRGGRRNVRARPFGVGSPRSSEVGTNRTAVVNPAPRRAFANSLPARYREHADAAAVIAHAHLAAERGSLPANLGTFSTYRTCAAALCVVARDRPGLLATISAALVLHNWDVIDAEAYTRNSPNNEREAVDLFWVQRSIGQSGEASDRAAAGDKSLAPMSPDEVTSLRQTLIGLLEGTIDAKGVTAKAAQQPVSPSCNTVVRFIEGRDGAFATLEVEASDRPGLLLALSKALFEKRLQIVSSEVRTQNGKVLDRFDVTEQDGALVTPERRLEVQVAVITAVESAMGRGSQTPRSA
jgi:[protein-PII] uridylyltransferase